MAPFDHGIMMQDYLEQCHVNTHTTSTPIGDASENKAIEEIFGEHADNLLISAPKSATGYMLAACGSVEV